jgi:outer membrane protein TolC
VKRASLLATALLLAAGAAAAQEPPPLPGGPPMTAEEALAAALRLDPRLSDAAAGVDGRAAALLQAEGLFSRTAGVHTRLDYLVGELFGGRLRGERDRRLRFEIPPPIFDDVAQKLIDRAPVVFGDREPGSLIYPDCTQATSFFVFRDEATGSIRSVLCFDSDDQLLGILGTGATGQDLNALNLAGLFNDLSGIDERLDDFVRAQLGLVADEMRLISIALRQAAESLRLQRIRIGEVPEDVETIKFDLGVDWSHRFRGGSSLVSSVSFASNEDNFVGKKLSPVFGDSFVANTFLATFGVALDVPLGRGGGRASAQAPVRAAERNLAASRALLAQLASRRALDALDAYWEAAAAERRLALVEDSRATQRELLAASEELVKADAIPSVDLKRNRARLAEVEAQVAGARQALSAARFGLARTLGLSAGSLAEAPHAAEPLETWLGSDPLTGGAEVEPLVERALAARDDLKAAAALVAANAALAEGARADLRPEVALSLKLSYSAFHESFKDRFYDFEGFERALEDQFAGPSYSAAIRFRFPVGNHEARGRLLQAESAAQQSRISEGDVRRTIRLRVTELASTVVSARAEIELARTALAAIEETHQGALERHRAGDMSVIDTLTTEAQRTSARLALIDAERRLLSLVAQLRFEVGALLEVPEAEAGSLAGARLRPLGEPLI